MAVGVVLIVYGLKASDSFGSDVSRFFTGSPTNKTIWVLIDEALSAGVGLAGVVRGSKG